MISRKNLREKKGLWFSISVIEFTHLWQYVSRNFSWVVFFKLQKYFCQATLSDFDRHTCIQNHWQPSLGPKVFIQNFGKHHSWSQFWSFLTQIKTSWGCNFVTFTAWMSVRCTLFMPGTPDPSRTHFLSKIEWRHSKFPCKSGHIWVYFHFYTTWKKNTEWNHCFAVFALLESIKLFSRKI